MRGDLLSLTASHVSHAAAGIFVAVAVQQFAPVPAPGHTYPVTEPRHRGEIKYPNHHIIRIESPAQQRNYTVCAVTAIHPIETGGVVVELMQGGFLTIHAV